MVAQKNTPYVCAFLWWSNGACFLTLKSGGYPFQALLKSRRVEVSAVLVTTGNPLCSLSKNMRSVAPQIVYQKPRALWARGFTPHVHNFPYSATLSKFTSYMIRSCAVV